MMTIKVRPMDCHFRVSVGITANGLGLCDGGASEYKSSNLAQCLIVVQMFNKPLMPCFCKTLVMGSTVFNQRVSKWK